MKYQTFQPGEWADFAADEWFFFATREPLVASTKAQSLFAPVNVTTFAKDHEGIYQAATAVSQT